MTPTEPGQTPSEADSGSTRPALDKVVSVAAELLGVAPADIVARPVGPGWRCTVTRPIRTVGASDVVVVPTHAPIRVPSIVADEHVLRLITDDDGRGRAG